MTSLACDGKIKSRYAGKENDANILQGFFDQNENTLHFGCKDNYFT